MLLQLLANKPRRTHVFRSTKVGRTEELIRYLATLLVFNYVLKYLEPRYWNRGE